MSDDLASWLRSQVDDDETLAESDYDIMISARKVRDASAEITYLRAVLAAARREGMGESADLCDDLPDHQGGICAIAIRMMIDEEDKKAAIRAAAKEGGKDE